MAAECPDLSGNPVYDDFFNRHELYERYHIHIVGLTSSKGGVGEAALETRRGWFGAPRVIDAVADPYVTVSTYGDVTGSTDYFPIGYHKFHTLTNCQTPLWDSKCVLLAKKESTTGVEIKFFDENTGRADEELFSFRLTREELPAATPLVESQWTHFTKTPEGVEGYENVVFEFNVMVTDGGDRVVTPDETAKMYEPNCMGVEGYEYSEEVIEDDTEAEDDNALLQCWRKPDNERAVLWVLGRNDCFMHPHMARKLFLDQGYDIYVINYKMNGHCRRRGWVQDPHYNSHNKEGNFDVYVKDIKTSLEHIQQYKQDYKTLLGYAHSTGGPVLLNYLMIEGDAAFNAFLFNSPFMDWGFVGGDMVEFVLENTGILTTLANYKNDSKVKTATTPDGTTPINYLGQEIVFSDWSARMWSMYHYEFGARPQYQVPMTIGFARGVTAVQFKMMQWNQQHHRAITAKPFLCITSRGDDVLKAPETLSRADWIGPGRWEIELNDNGHDVFLSYDYADNTMAIDLCLTWMRNRRLTDSR